MFLYLHLLVLSYPSPMANEPVSVYILYECVCLHVNIIEYFNLSFFLGIVSQCMYVLLAWNALYVFLCVAVLCMGKAKWPYFPWAKGSAGFNCALSKQFRKNNDRPPY